MTQPVTPALPGDSDCSRAPESKHFAYGSDGTDRLFNRNPLATLLPFYFLLAIADPADALN
jgi:hypothetical protein